MDFGLVATLAFREIHWVKWTEDVLCFVEILFVMMAAPQVDGFTILVE